MRDYDRRDGDDRGSRARDRPKEFSRDREGHSREPERKRDEDRRVYDERRRPSDERDYRDHSKGSRDHVNWQHSGTSLTVPGFTLGFKILSPS